jgi:hypothetical protein
VDATKTSMCRSRKLDLPRSTEGLFSFGTVEGTYDGLFLGQRCTSHIISCRGRLSSNIFKSCFASKHPVEFLFHVNANMSLRCKLKKNAGAYPAAVGFLCIPRFPNSSTPYPSIYPRLTSRPTSRHSSACIMGTAGSPCLTHIETRHHVPTHGLGHSGDRGHPSSPLLHAEWVATPRRRMHRSLSGVALVRSALISSLAMSKEGANRLGWVRRIEAEV